MLRWRDINHNAIVDNVDMVMRTYVLGSFHALLHEFIRGLPANHVHSQGLFLC
jgi:hypothetical protein